MAKENRLSNLDKLYLLPAFAAKDLLLSRIPADDERVGKIRRMRQDLLLQEIDKEPTITEADIERVHEIYRYGRRLSFQLHLLPSNLPAITDPQEMLASLTTLVDEQRATTRSDQEPVAEEYESDEPLRNVVICDYERFDDTLEIRYKYQVIHRFLNEDEEPDRVYETRYGFMWLSMKEGYLAILSRDEKINKVLTGVLSRALKIWPIPVKLPKELLDDHFPLERARRLSHLDPQTRVRQSISGESAGLEQYQAEILSRDSKFLRPGALYDEDIENGLTSGLGVTARKGKLYLTRTLSTSTVRRWAQRRLPELVQDLREWTGERPESTVGASPIVSRLKVTEQGKVYIVRIIEALLQAKREARSCVSLGISSFDLFMALGARYLNPFIHFECEECDELCCYCTNCQSSNLLLTETQIECADCLTSLVHEGEIGLQCVNGHSSTISLDEALGFVPRSFLERPVHRALEAIGVSWLPGREQFYIEGNSLYHLFGGPDEPTTLVAGDYIVAQIGDEAKEVVVGKNITVRR